MLQDSDVLQQAKAKFYSKNESAKFQPVSQSF